ncbi:hypothetical protein Tco_0744531 [Tanacetum coccineum]
MPNNPKPAARRSAQLSMLRAIHCKEVDSGNGILCILLPLQEEDACWLCQFFGSATRILSSMVPTKKAVGRSILRMRLNALEPDVSVSAKYDKRISTRFKGDTLNGLL